MQDLYQALSNGGFEVEVRPLQNLLRISGVEVRPRSAEQRRHRDGSKYWLVRHLRLEPLSDKPWLLIMLPTAQRAVVYLRASTEMQQYSTTNQLTEVVKFAEANGIEIVGVYEDHARSGLTLDRRDALKRLLSDVLRPDRGFDEVLVYDITRWGRFQDSDQAAYYEYHCRMHGAPVRYTMDPSINNGTPMAALMKAIQRVSAADYSRTLSLKVIAGFARLARGKFALGSGAPFGYWDQK